MNINGERLLSDLTKLKDFTDTPGEGVTRFSYSENDRKARQFIKEAAESHGFAVRTDPIGNMYIRFDGHIDHKGRAGHVGQVRPADHAGHDEQAEQTGQPDKICIGSHIDTVRNGGWLDGIYGVVSGLEVLRTLAENQNECLPMVEVVIFAEEEGSNFGSTMTGSKFVSGIYGEEDLNRLKNDEGVSLKEMLADSGFPSYREHHVRWNFSDIKAMLELHIEQGPVLEEQGNSIGVVDAIFGMKTIEVTIAGTGNHAGATPMIYRRDALVTAALCITAVEQIAKDDPEGVTVATVGKITAQPNCSNVIAEKAIFTVEVRDNREDRINTVLHDIENSIIRITDERGTSCTIRSIANSKPFHMNSTIIKLMDRLATEAGIRHQIIDSGAVHDTCMIAAHVPAGMLFVPSKGGRSHVPFEDTDPEDLVRGAQLLLDTVLNLE